MKFIAYDLGTGGVKASLYDSGLKTMAKVFLEVETLYPGDNLHEQRPGDWWRGVCDSTKELLAASGTDPAEVGCVALSSMSLVAIPLDRDLRPLLDQVPIWSDTRAVRECADFFSRIDRDLWYQTTGNGFPPPCYSLFKLMWVREHQPDVFARTHRVAGAKDYINLRLTGNLYTDASYASGTGAYSLREREMRGEFLEAAGIPASFFPAIVPAHTIVGRVLEAAARESGLAPGTPVACGGVDNACMALGALGTREGGVYTSLGSSSWLPVTSREPVLDPVKKPYVFAHIEEGLFTSAFSIFSGGNSLRWVRETLCPDLAGNPEAYRVMDRMAATAPVGAGGILFNPSLAGGTSQDRSVNIRGAYVGLHLGTTRPHMIRAAMEGIAMNLRLCLDELRRYVSLSDRLLFCGGGSKSPFWMQMFADIFGMEVVKTNIDQDAASLGAAAIAARAAGIWRDYAPVPGLHRVEAVHRPDGERAAQYERLVEVFAHVNGEMALLGDYMKEHL